MGRTLRYQVKRNWSASLLSVDLLGNVTHILLNGAGVQDKDDSTGKLLYLVKHGVADTLMSRKVVESEGLLKGESKKLSK